MFYSFPIKHLTHLVINISLQSRINNGIPHKFEGNMVLSSVHPIYLLIFISAFIFVKIWTCFNRKRTQTCLVQDVNRKRQKNYSFQYLKDIIFLPWFTPLTLLYPLIESGDILKLSKQTALSRVFLPIYFSARWCCWAADRYSWRVFFFARLYKLPYSDWLIFNWIWILQNWTVLTAEY